MKHSVFQKFLESAACNFCGGVRARLLFRGRERRYISVPPDVWCGVVRCEGCGLVYLSPRVREEFIGLWYPKEEYYVPYSPPGDSRGERLKRDFQRLAAKRYLGYPASGVRLESGLKPTWLRCLLPFVYRVFRFRFRRILPFLPGGRVLDFGFGSGDFLLRMKDLGWECWGVEREGDILGAMNRAGIRAFSNLMDPAIPSGYFDWVTAYHSIEHVYDPRALLRRIFDVIKPGGRIYLGVPNLDSFVGRVFRTFWDNLGVPLHPYVFTVASAGKYLEDAGFRIISVNHASPPQGILGSVQYAINSAITSLRGRDYHGMGIRESRVLALLVVPLSKMFDGMGMGDCIEVVAQKPRDGSPRGRRDS